MESACSSEQQRLRSWYSRLRPPMVDIVGDFAGRDLFLIHGESLIRHCLKESRVDFEGGLQLLHAVYAVEQFLSNLAKRGCNFDLVFFRHYSQLCLPHGVSGPANGYKYELARAIIIGHLQVNLNQQASTLSGGRNPRILEFDSELDAGFLQYLQNHMLQFFLCHDGGDGSGADDQSLAFQYLIHHFVSYNRNVAVINTVQWKSSKVFASLISGNNSSLVSLEYTPPTSTFTFADAALESFKAFKEVLLNSAPVSEPDSNSLRRHVAIAACKAIREHGPDKETKAMDGRIQAFLIHIAVLEQCTLAERPCQRRYPSLSATQGGDGAFLSDLCHIIILMLQSGECQTHNADLVWDLFDMMDGRIFSAFLEMVRAGNCVPEPIQVSAGNMMKAVIGVGVNPPPTQPSTPETLEPDMRPIPSLLEFSHPVIDPFLSDIELTQTIKPSNKTTDMVFNDLHHWHNNKSIDQDWKPKRLGFFARKRNQQKQSDMVEYSASLTNSQGKIMEPETIIVQPHASTTSSGAVTKSGSTGNTARAYQHKTAKSGVKGTQAAHQEARALQDRKAMTQDNTVAKFWKERCAEIEKITDLVRSYTKAESLLSGDMSRALGPEIELYLCHLLGKMWRASGSQGSQDVTKDLHLLAVVWNHVQQASQQSTTPEILDHLQKLTKVLSWPETPLRRGLNSRELSFKFEIDNFKSRCSSMPDSTSLQLEYGGAYMHRQFDSQPDPRVRFQPDAWQRRVLDCIDADKSLLVVAPTSAGKTFISSYAMKRTLEQSDDGILVYVAPTKALVNQVAAEINANFSKKYAGSGAKSVWAIHTRDYKVHNPLTCQILVTVPHMLQIMLLSPPNAKGHNPWSLRIKRIIFDEVHSIGQSEDGVVWEQLLLQAPCPIIALSATVANPNELKEWLTRTQSLKGHEMEMIVHEVRYSDLRKFFYNHPGNKGPFTGLQTTHRLPVPGLDEGDSPCTHLIFIHPVVSLSDYNVSAISDLSLEARDCFNLWRALKQTCSVDVLRTLGVYSPQKTLPNIVTKQDVVKWEKELKIAVRRGFEEHLVSLQSLRQHLGSKFQAREVEDHVDSLFTLACDLHGQNSLPALVFNYDRAECERAARKILNRLVTAENDWKDSSPSWKNKLAAFEKWKESKAAGLKNSKLRGKGKSKGKKSRDDDNDEERLSKLDQVIEQTSRDASPWDGFDPDAPLEPFSFADQSKVPQSEFEKLCVRLQGENLKEWLTDALRRGVGVHHAGMNLRYRQTVEILFRRGYLRLVVATGTLALGINMPCKTVIFSGDSVWLTPQNYRQCSGRAGRRGFDLLGNVVFNGFSVDRVHEIMSSRLPDLKGQFPLSTTLILRLFSLLHGTDNSKYAQGVITSLISQTRLYLGGPESMDAIKHHLRFSIEYLRQQDLLSEKGEPLNFSGLVTHLYFTENAVFAFHSLLKGGFFHTLCANVGRNPENTLLEMMLVLCHLFQRVPVRRTPEAERAIHRSPSGLFLPRLPQMAERLLVEHNAETLSIFKGYVQSYVHHNLEGKCDRTLPLTSTQVGHEQGGIGNLFDAPRIDIRSPFIALSGLDDDFGSIHELCSTVRSDVFLEESAIPYIPVWPHDDGSHELNSYIYDFYKHGSMKTLVSDNHIKAGDVWFHLKDFALTLATIVASLEGLVTGQSVEYQDDVMMFGDDSDEGDSGDVEDDVNEGLEVPREKEIKKARSQTKPKARTKEVVKDSWDESSSESGDGSDSEASEEMTSTHSLPIRNGDRENGSGERPGDGLVMVHGAFALLKKTFDEKFQKVWA